MAALNNLESGFNAKLVLSKSHAASRALSLTPRDKTIQISSSRPITATPGAGLTVLFIPFLLK